jgi:predicted small lipoprotein YifL
MRLATLVIAAALLSGCGLKDDLFLPPPKPAAAPATQPGAGPAAPAGEDEETQGETPRGPATPP